MYKFTRVLGKVQCMCLNSATHAWATCTHRVYRHYYMRTEEKILACNCYACNCYAYLNLLMSGTVHRASETYHWPLMNAEIRDHIAQCSVCNTIRPEQCWKELIPCELPGQKLAQTYLHLTERTMLWVLTIIPRCINWVKLHQVLQLRHWKNSFQGMAYQIYYYQIMDINAPQLNFGSLHVYRNSDIPPHHQNIPKAMVKLTVLWKLVSHCLRKPNWQRP